MGRESIQLDLVIANVHPFDLTLRKRERERKINSREKEDRLEKTTLSRLASIIKRIIYLNGFHVVSKANESLSFSQAPRLSRHHNQVTSDYTSLRQQQYRSHTSVK